jgi:type IV pilus assembly protein PilX
MNLQLRYGMRSILLKRQQGVVLIVALVMLLIMTVAGITTMSGATLQERIAGNQRQQIIARANGGHALRQAEFDLNALSNNGSFVPVQLDANFAAVNDGLYSTEPIDGAGAAQPIAFDRSNDTLWNGVNSVPVLDAGGNLVGRYVIEYLGLSGFTATSQGLGLGGGGSYDDPVRDGEEGGGGRKVFRITALGIANDNNITTIIGSFFFERE